MSALIITLSLNLIFLIISVKPITIIHEYGHAHKAYRLGCTPIIVLKKTRLKQIGKIPVRERDISSGGLCIYKKTTRKNEKKITLSGMIMGDLAIIIIGLVPLIISTLITKNITISLIVYILISLLLIYRQSGTRSVSKAKDILLSARPNTAVEVVFTDRAILTKEYEECQKIIKEKNLYEI